MKNMFKLKAGHVCFILRSGLFVLFASSYEHIWKQKNSPIKQDFFPSYYKYRQGIRELCMSIMSERVLYIWFIVLETKHIATAAFFSYYIFYFASHTNIWIKEFVLLLNWN
jgi:hypothetical protein